jgi:hypothetical protein
VTTTLQTIVSQCIVERHNAMQCNLHTWMNTIIIDLTDWTVDSLTSWYAAASDSPLRTGGHQCFTIVFQPNIYMHGYDTVIDCLPMVSNIIHS